jgi:hypothetical protein
MRPVPQKDAFLTFFQARSTASTIYFRGISWKISLEALVTLRNPIQLLVKSVSGRRLRRKRSAGETWRRIEQYVRRQFQEAATLLVRRPQMISTAPCDEKRLKKDPARRGDAPGGLQSTRCYGSVTPLVT